VDALVEQLQAAVNKRDPQAVCALYGYPSPVCVRVWSDRLERLRIPIDLRVRYVVGSCDGGPRATLTTRLVKDKINSVTYVPDRGWIADIGIGMRRSGLLVPRYGSCADMDGSGGDPECDVASASGYEDTFNECKGVKD
jgi:hypothetical protein